MFSSQNNLKRKTPEQGINRQQYIEHLVEEYYTSTNVEAQEQVTANLANFAYDPINWDYLKKSEVLKLFIELLETANEKLHVHGSAGLCNICLDIEAHTFLVKTCNIKVLLDLLLTTKNATVILHILTLFYQLLSNPQSAKSSILNTKILKRVKDFQKIYESDQRIINISSLLLEDFAMCLSKQQYSSKASIFKKTELKVTKIFTQQDLDNFSLLTGDCNYIHTKAVPQEQRKVQGALLNAVVAGIIGTQFPGAGTIVLEQKFSFPKPCRIETSCEFFLKLQQNRKISIISYECKQNENIVFKGDAKLLISDN